MSYLETCDSIKSIRLFQAKTGYRFSVDALLLEDFISAKHLSKGIELGTGSGIISILLAKKNKNIKKIIAVEIQHSFAERAKRNVELNKLSKRIEVFAEDIKNLRKIFPPNKFDFAFSNPPFRKTKSGLLSIDEERAVARHEIKITLPDIISTASYLIKNTGRFYLIYHPFRLIELITLFRSARLEPKRMRFVHSSIGEEAKMVMIEAVKGSGQWLKIDPPLYIYEKGSEYTDEMKRIYGE
ncbi:MAG: tRNA1(Val) (adenine(37)-N6)-methyltransferase [Nitrospirae bacterium]|nr:tRNA1(Val) (adenine(37)-N6)-methyltransferase [Nitrospirota bacterium]